MGRPGARQLCQFVVRRHGVPDQKFTGYIQSPVQIDGCEHGLERIHQETLFGATSSRLLAAAQLQVAPEFQFMRDGEKMSSAD